MTSKWVKNGKVAHEAIAECVTSLRLCCARENPTITGYFEAVLEENSAREVTVAAISSFQRASFSNCSSPTHTLGARGFSCAVSGVGYVSIAARVRTMGGKPLVPRV